MTGSLDVRNFDDAQQFFVHRGNPLTHLTLAQLDAIFGAQHRRGAANIRTWGQLGLRGAWAARRITPYGWALDDSFAIYLGQYLLAGSHEWNCALRRFRHVRASMDASEPVGFEPLRSVRAPVILTLRAQRSRPSDSTCLIGQTVEPGA